MRRTCLHCKAAITWMRMAPDGRKIPVNVEPDTNGALMLDETTGWLVKSFPTNVKRLRFRSHLLDCRALAKASYFRRNIPVETPQTGDEVAPNLINDEDEDIEDGTGNVELVF